MSESRGRQSTTFTNSLNVDETRRDSPIRHLAQEELTAEDCPMSATELTHDNDGVDDDDDDDDDNDDDYNII